MKKFIILAIIIGGILSGLLYWQAPHIRDWWWQRQQAPVPTAVSFQDANHNSTEEQASENTNENSSLEKEEDEDNEASSNEGNNKNTEEADPVVIPETLNLDVPFTSQAPEGNWDLPYQEACEEASSLMAARYLQGRSIDGASDANQAILELVDFGTNELDFPIDTNAEQTAQLIEDFYDLETELIVDFTWDDVKKALAQGYPVILPAAGQELDNPNFTAPGPIYHMLVIKGYTANKVITNDPGTRRGADYQYTYDTLYNAAHDWNNGDVTNGQKVIIIVKPAS